MLEHKEQESCRVIKTAFVCMVRIRDLCVVAYIRTVLQASTC